jgi:hypothetical protein
MSSNLAEELNDRNTDFEEPMFTDNLRILCINAIENGNTSVSLYSEFESSSDKARFITKLQNHGFGVDYKECYRFESYNPDGCEDYGHTEDCNLHCIITWKQNRTRYEYK